MSREVWRYKLAVTTSQRIEMPSRAQLIHVAEHPLGDISIWAIVDPTAPRVTREFAVAGTGWKIVADEPTYIGSVAMRAGWVFHVFETQPTVQDHPDGSK